MDELEIAFYDQELLEELIQLFNESSKEDDDLEIRKINGKYERSFWLASPDTRKASQVIMNKPRNLIRKVI